MAVVYINPNASPGGSGASLVDALDAFPTTGWTAGNEYLLLDGTTHVGAVTPNASGTSGARIVIGVCDQSGARVSRQGAATLLGSAAAHGLNLGTRSYITVDGLRCVAGAGSARNGINGLAADALTAHYITLQNVVASSPLDATGNGVQLRGVGDVFDNVLLDDCAVDGAFLTVSDFTASRVVARNFDLSRGDGDGIQFAGTHDYGAVRLRRLSIYGHTDNPIKQCIITAAGTGDFLLEESTLEGMVTGLLVAIPGAVVRRVVAQGCVQRGFTMAAPDQVLESCVVSGTPRGVAIDAANTGIALRNVTLTCSDEGVTATTSGASYSVNNSAIDAPLAHTIATGVTFSGGANCYSERSRWKVNSTIHTALADWQSASSADSESLVEDFVAGGPLPGSPLLSGGADLGYLRDIRGFQSRKHIGAYGAARLRY